MLRGFSGGYTVLRFSLSSAKSAAMPSRVLFTILTIRAGNGGTGGRGVQQVAMVRFPLPSPQGPQGPLENAGLQGAEVRQEASEGPPMRPSQLVVVGAGE